MISKEYLWFETFEICTVDKLDSFFINCCVYSHSLCKDCFQRLQSKKCPFCWSDMEVRRQERQMSCRDRSTLVQNVEMTNRAWENWNTEFSRRQGFSIISLFTNIPVSNIDAIYEVIETGYFDDALSNGGRCRCPYFTRQYIQSQ